MLNIMLLLLHNCTLLNDLSLDWNNFQEPASAAALNQCLDKTPWLQGSDDISRMLNIMLLLHNCTLSLCLMI